MKLNSNEAFFEFNEALASSKRVTVAKCKSPILFICGAPRSGTTIAYQCLVHGGRLGCVTNLVARFVANPPLGVRLAQALNLPDEFSGRSTFGKTSGLTEPHEFGLGWQKILGLDNLIQPNITKTLSSEVIDEITNLASAWEKPVVFKSFAYLWFIEQLYRCIPNSIWLHVYRQDDANAQSLKKLYEIRSTDNESSEWQSAACRKTIDEAKGLKLDQRCLRQVADINEHIRSQFKHIPKHRHFDISHQEFVNDASAATKKILDYFQLPVDTKRLKEIEG